jgi:uncharacterized protein (TIRG00374 family)
MELSMSRVRFSRRLRRIVWGLMLIVIVEYLVLPQLAGARKSLSLLGQVNPLLLLAGVALEAAAIIAYANLTRAVLPSESRPPLSQVLRIDLSTLAVSHTVPAGAAVGGSLGYRLLTETGVRGTDAGFALATQSLGSAVVLNVLLWIGLVVSIPFRGLNPLYGTAAIVGAVLLAAFAFAVVGLTSGRDRVAKVACRIADRLPGISSQQVDDVLHRVAERLRVLGKDRALLQRAIGWAAANWLLDAASLWVFVGAFGHWVSPDALIVSFGLANVLAAIPLTPGGLGVVEATLTSTLVGFGTPRGVAILGVLAYRLVNFWLPIPLGGLAYASLRVGPAAIDEVLEETERKRRAPEPPPAR